MGALKQPRGTTSRSIDFYKEQTLRQQQRPLSLFFQQSASDPDPDSVETKEAWLESMLKDNENVDISDFLIVLEALAASAKTNSGAPQRAEVWMNKLLLEVEKRNDLKNDELVSCYNAVIFSWANSTMEDVSLCVTRSKIWFDKLLKSKVQPNTDSFHALLHASSRGRTKNKKALQSHAELALETLRHMQQQQNDNVTVNTDSFNYVIRAWTRCRSVEATDQVMDLLREMEQHQRDQPLDADVRPNTKAYCMAMDAWANLAGRHARKQRQQQKIEFEDQDDASLYAVRQVEAILDYMHKLRNAGVPDVLPNTVAYNTLISAWTRVSGTHSDAPLQAEKVMRRMQLDQNTLPDSSSYTKVILAWTKSGRANAGIRASWWLDKLWEKFEDATDEDKKKRLLPRVNTYNSVIMAWANVGNASKAEVLLQEMLDQNKKSNGRVPPRPNTESFSHVINAWLKSEQRCGNGQACRKAAEWLEKLEQLEEEQQNQDSTVHATTTPDMYNGILKAAVRSNAKGPELLDLALTVFDKYRASRHLLDYKSYEWLLQLGLETLSSIDYDEERTIFIHQLFRDCCDDGLVSNVFVRALANGKVFYNGWTIEESFKMTQELLNEWPLPPAWSRNVQREHNLPTWEDCQRTNFNVQIS